MGLYKKYLKESGIEKMVALTEFEVFDVESLAIKMGWKDMDRERKIEQYNGNKAEREKHYTIPERLCGTVYLEYPLNGQSSE